MARLIAVSFVLAALVLAVVENRATDAAADATHDLEKPAVHFVPQRCLDNSVTKVSCAHMGSNATLVPHPDDCGLFYWCVSPHMPPICLQCPASLHFNREELICDYAYNAGCQ